MGTGTIDLAARSADTATPESIRAATYAEFLYGYGAAPDVDLGIARQFSQPQPKVFQQRFDHGLTVANVGDRPVRVELPAPHRDLDGRTLSVAVIAPHSAEVFRALPRSGAATDPRRQGQPERDAAQTRLPQGRTAQLVARAGCCC